MNKPNQRKGSKSNAHVGAAFESIAQIYFNTLGIKLDRRFSLEVGVGKTKKKHNFDLGSKADKIIVECKSHTWTEGNKVPVAKMTTWNEAMYLFSLVDEKYEKIFFVKHDRRKTSGQSLLDYYIYTYPHLIPGGVKFIEYDEETETIVERK